MASYKAYQGICQKKSHVSEMENSLHPELLIFFNYFKELLHFKILNCHKNRNFVTMLGPSFVDKNLFPNNIPFVPVHKKKRVNL
ncbi:hypothetical protein AGMMS49574_04660 [Bacteroidia bacterium]|nr:hypothetical protein AGMMS49574_04660 [Bacteroidia bacterium]